MNATSEQDPAFAPLNFVLSTSSNYAEVQEQILSCIRKHLAPNEYTAGFSTPTAEALNFTLFVNGRADALMSHGVADKNYMYRRGDDGSRLVNRFSHVMVPGPWLRDRMIASKTLSLSPEQIHSVGWPRLDRLLEVKATRVRLPDDGRLRVLWAPTHDFARRGEDEVSTSSYPGMLKHVSKLEREFAFLTSLHPRNRNDKRPTLEALLHCDVVVSDFGTMVYEAWALGIPVIFPHWIIGDAIRRYLPNSAEALIFSERIGLHPDSFGAMLEMLRSRPTIGEDVRRFMAAYLDPDHTGTSGLRIAGLLRDLAVEKRARHAVTADGA